MNNIIVLPLIIPIVTAIVLVFLRQNIRVQRIVSLVTVVAVSIIALILLLEVQANGIMKIDFSGWLPPFGILFVADSFSMLLVLTANIITAICLIYAFSTIGERHEQMFFYPFVLFLIAGVNGSFLTGDIFNLFVCFEVMLLASYALVALGGEKFQLRESLKYVLINVVASWMFLVALAYLYGTLKTLNMAHIAVRVAEVGQDPILTTVAILFLIVFSLKAGLLLFFWLPGSYSVPPTVVQALFAALLTKVGIYALFRTFTLMFTLNTGVTHMLIGVMAGITIVLGCLGALSGRDVRTIAAYNVIIGVGFIMIGLAVGTEQAFAGAIYYLMHDMLAKALLFLIVGTMVYLTGEIIVKNMNGLIRHYPLFGWIYFIVMCALAGIPPLSGFIGKVLIGQQAVEGGFYVLLAIGFGSSVIVLYSLLRIFLAAFFGETSVSDEDKKPIPKAAMASFVMLALCIVALGLGAEGIAVYVEDAARTLANPAIYIEAILGAK
ncbi:Na+/H+ antiporter subunit D [Metasolibacillus sp.]|uniref:Na+/H+ antiporter subunit D n=1 Tax=Metasolibacillus sp. TaxID=2703680 RepID=UPI0025E223D4|nr:Na+/H+ antiporter subunit D [Metasolibacillus sp.]MCT6925764.1 Na+/H+ antiporter subunit D [Metasolibacillus sp.]MCT6941946.1 Na+/H+ antiporter subunit D [Metasolibacillus sp.]